MTFVRSTMVAIVIGLSVSCSLLQSAKEVRTEAPRQSNLPPPERRVSQLGFGGAAHYAACMDPACPAITPKTLPVAIRDESLKVTGDTEPARLHAATPQPDRPLEKPEPSSPVTRTLILQFASNSALLTTSHRTRLSEAIGELRRADRLLIVGRTDDQGSEALNEQLALARALAIRDHLLTIDPALPPRISIDAKGRCCYTAPNDNASNRARNRRVELLYPRRDGAAS